VLEALNGKKYAMPCAASLQVQFLQVISIELQGLIFYKIRHLAGTIYYQIYNEQKR